ncbi:hypothetical protein JCM15415_11860 [Methanobacterium movens]
MNSIINLKERINELKKTDKLSYKVLISIYDVDFGIGIMEMPSELENKFKAYFRSNNNQQGSDKQEDVRFNIKNQGIIKTYNKWTHEGALFNHLRINRPGMKNKDSPEHKEELRNIIENSKKNCDFCNPLNSTPSDVFGRVTGKYSVTASNIAKYDVWSSLIIFKNHNPLEFSLNEISDYFHTAFKWFKKAYEYDEQCKFPFMVWNCLYKAGASQVHGHAQILMSKGNYYARMQNLKAASLRYNKKTGRDYFQDWYQAHHDLGLAFSTENCQVMASITPTKEKDIVILSPESPLKNKKMIKVTYEILRYFIDVLGVDSFNLALSPTPMDQEYEMPYIINIVDRGPIFRSTVDMGGMELFGSSVVAEDPSNLIESLKKLILNPDTG